jgi:drug/metabolite transporter (DMT)-like permease
MKNKEALGIMFKIVNLLIFTCISLLSKSIKHVNPFIIYFIATSFGALMYGAIYYYKNRNFNLDLSFKSRSFILYLVRSGLCMLAMVTWFKVLSLTQFAKATAINYLTPIFSTIIAVVFLKEQATKYTIIALGLGFSGAFIILSPQTGVDLGALLAILCAVMWAMHDCIIKYQSFKDSALKQVFIYFSILAFYSFIPSIYFYRSISVQEFFYCILMGLLFMLNGFALTFALANARVIVLTPISFLRLILAAITGYLFFNEQPNNTIFLGAIMILIGVFVTIKYKLKKTD